MSNYPEGVELEDRPCPLGCARNDKFVLVGGDRIRGIPGKYKVVRCANCSLMRTNPRPTSQTIGAYYPADYGPYVSTSIAQAPKLVGWKERIKKLLGLGDKRLPDIPPGRMLEIGCASGAYLEEMCSLGWQVEGIEFSESAAKVARSKGVQVQCATVENATDPSETADVVAAWMVLEHLHEPVDALKRIRTWINPDGYLIASVPDGGIVFGRVFGNARYDLHLPNHLYHFTPKSLEKLLRLSGWELERVYWQKTCKNLLWSLEYVARSQGWGRVAHTLARLRTSEKTGTLRTLLGWLLGVTRQSGRIEFWARPK